MGGKGSGSRPIDIRGQRYGRLVVVELFDRQRRKVRWLCRCDCGKETLVKTDRLNSGHTRSCGCLISDKLAARNRTHGKCDTPEWSIWIGMLSRCRGCSPNYGGRGITVCERWRSSFENFLADMGPRPTRRHSIDRIDVNGNYEPSNCRWATMVQQNRNTRRTVKLTLDGVTKPIRTWSEEVGINPATVMSRIARGWDKKRALLEPVRAIAKKSLTRSKIQTNHE